MLTLAPDIRQRLKSRLLNEEGYKQFPYVDTTGHETIAIGRNLAVVGISLDEALYLLDNDISRCEKDLWHYAPWYGSLDDVRKSVVLDMCFEMGINGVLEFREMITYLSSRSFKQASDAMLASLWAKQVPSRAQNLALIIETGVL